jgi:hypothetical protein
MEYMLLIYHNESEKLPEATQHQLFQEYMTFTQDITKAGKNKGGAPLEQSATATTVRVRNGKTRRKISTRQSQSRRESRAPSLAR